jgi:hypothetical protein
MGSSASSGIFVGGGSRAENCYVHDGASPGIAATNGTVTDCLVANLTGASSDGIKMTNGLPAVVLRNTVYSVGRHGCSLSTAFDFGQTEIRGNIFVNCGGYGLANLIGAGVPAAPEWDGNAYYSNTSGNRNNLDDTSTTPVNGSAPYTNVYDITATTTPALTSLPFVNVGSLDFRLNNTAGGGASLRGNAPGNTLPGLSTTGYRDFGAIQHQDAVASGSGQFISG